MLDTWGMSNSALEPAPNSTNTQVVENTVALRSASAAPQDAPKPHEGLPKPVAANFL